MKNRGIAELGQLITQEIRMMKIGKTFIIFCMFSVLLQNCLNKTFRSDIQPRWMADKPIIAKVEVIVSDDSMNESYPFRKVYELERISSETKIKYEKTLIGIIKESSLFYEDSNSKYLKIEFKHEIKRDQLLFTDRIKKTFMFLFTLQLYPLTYNEFHNIELIVSDKKNILYTKKSEEKTYLMVSIWYIFLLNFYNNSTARDRIFYEHSSLLLKDFFEFYTEQEKLKEFLKSKGK